MKKKRIPVPDWGDYQRMKADKLSRTVRFIVMCLFVFGFIIYLVNIFGQ